MATYRRSSAPVLSNAFSRSISPSGRFYSGGGAGHSMMSSPSSSAFASCTSSFATRSSNFFQRPASPTRVNLSGASPPSVPSVRFSIDRHHPTSPGHHSLAVDAAVVNKPAAASHSRRTCMCSPTTHPGSFRCSLHKATADSSVRGLYSSPSHKLNARRSAMTNSLVRIGTVEGELVKRALTALIRPSSHHQRRRAAFHPKLSRLSIMSKADDL